MTIELVTIILTGLGAVVTTIVSLGVLLGFGLRRMDRKFDSMQGRFDSMDRKFDKVQQELHWQGERVARVETKIEVIDERLARLETEMRHMDRGVARLEAHYTKYGIYSEPEIKSSKVVGEN